MDVLRDPPEAGVMGGVGSTGKATAEGEMLGLGIDVFLDGIPRGVELDLGV